MAESNRRPNFGDYLSNNMRSPPTFVNGCLVGGLNTDYFDAIFEGVGCITHVMGVTADRLDFWRAPSAPRSHGAGGGDMRRFPDTRKMDDEQMCWG